jgi:hypothetical protein
MTNHLPPAKFERFERVVFTGEPRHAPELHGKHGTVLWRDPYWVRSPRETVARLPRPDRWLYLVYFPVDQRYQTLFQADLQSEGTFDLESAHLGSRPEISFDTVLEGDEDYIEGTYRLPGKFWQVMVWRKADFLDLRFRPNQPPLEWESGITGVVFDVPRTAKLNRPYIFWAMTEAFGYRDWVEVAGPDSMVLR